MIVKSLTNENIWKCTIEVNILQIKALFAHGDQKDLLKRLSALENKPSKVYLVYGEIDALNKLKKRIIDKYHFDSVVPLMGQEFDL